MSSWHALSPPGSPQLKRAHQGGNKSALIAIVSAALLLACVVSLQPTAAGAAARLRLQLEGGLPEEDGALQQQQQQPQQQPQALSDGAARGGSAAGGADAQQPGKPQPVAVRRRRFAESARRCLETWGGLDCLTEQQKDVEPGPGQFRLPHFYIVGYQKCATTSLYHYLLEHPQILSPGNKEPDFLRQGCAFNALRCPRAPQRDYIWRVLGLKEAAEADFQLASFEASTHYALEGRWLAPQMRQLFPWARIVLSMRDPISQAVSMVNHNLDSDREVSCYARGNGTVFQCCREYLDAGSRYAPSMRAWVDAFPRDQLHIIQYENLTAAGQQAGALRDLKSFLGLALDASPDELGLYNARRQRQTEGWPMLRREYQQLVELARRNAQEVASIVGQHGFADADAWLANWEAAWKANLEDNCGPGPDGECRIQLT